MSSAAVMRPQALPANNGLPSPSTHSASHTTTPTPTPSPYQAPAFDPKKHMCYTPPSKTFALSDLNLNPTNATSPVAITTPFPLLTEEGVHALRADIFRHEIVSKYGSLKYPGVYRIRGYGPDAPFTYALWKSETMRAACSAAAGVELELIMDYEIGQLNVQLDASIDKNAPITDNLPPIVPPRETAADVDPNEKEDDLKDLVSAWHYDSYPWVCVMMLSDPIGMRGGETALRTSDGSIRKVAQPGMGYAVMMQGSVINHAALRCLGNGERITFVTSFRNRDVNKRDTSSLRTVKPISDKGELFRQWGSYRMDVLSKRAQGIHEKLDSMKGRSQEEVTKLLSEWAEEQIEYLKHTIAEMS